MNETYLTPYAVEQSIKDAAKIQFQNGSKTSISDLILNRRSDYGMIY
jgi:hypothetical protein